MTDVTDLYVVLVRWSAMNANPQYESINLLQVKAQSLDEAVEKALKHLDPQINAPGEWNVVMTRKAIKIDPALAI